MPDVREGQCVVLCVRSLQVQGQRARCHGARLRRVQDYPQHQPNVVELRDAERISYCFREMFPKAEVNTPDYCGVRRMLIQQFFLHKNP